MSEFIQVSAAEIDEMCKNRLDDCGDSINDLLDVAFCNVIHIMKKEFNCIDDTISKDTANYFIQDGYYSEKIDPTCVIILKQGFMSIEDEENDLRCTEELFKKVIVSDNIIAVRDGLNNTSEQHKLIVYYFFDQYLDHEEFRPYDKIKWIESNAEYIQDEALDKFLSHSYDILFNRVIRFKEDPIRYEILFWNKDSWGGCNTDVEGDIEENPFSYTWEESPAIFLE